MGDFFKWFYERGKYQVPKNTPQVPVVSDFIYWLCLFAGLGGIIAYISGYKKGGKLTVLSIMVYWILAAICTK